MAFSPSVTHSVGTFTRQCDMSKRKKRWGGNRRKKRWGGNRRKNRATFVGFVSRRHYYDSSPFYTKNPPGLWTGSKTLCLTSGLTDPFLVPLKMISRNNILKINF